MGRADELDAWMARLADGDRTAFDPLYDALWPVLSSFCARRLGDATRGEDAAQQALVRVFEKASTYDPARPALPWVLAFAHWECRTAAGRASRAREDGPVDAIDSGVDPEAAAMRADLRAAVQAAVGAMSPNDEAALWAWVERDVAEVAAGATLRKRIERARRRFADLWRRHHGPT